MNRIEGLPTAVRLSGRRAFARLCSLRLAVGVVCCLAAYSALTCTASAQGLAHRVSDRSAWQRSAASSPKSVGDPLQAITAQTTGAATTTDPSAIPVPSGNVSGWKQVFSDNFSTNVPLGGFSNCKVASTLASSDCSGLPAAVSAKWFAYPDGWSDTVGNGIYQPSQVLSIRNNELDFYIHENASGEPLVSAPVPKIPGAGAGGGLLYGAFMVRFRADLLPGYKTAWLLWPDAYDNGQASWPSDGEVDFPEGDLNGNIGAFMHWQGATTGSQQDGYSTSGGYGQWQTALIEWTATEVKFVLNGHVVGASTQHVPDTAMHWVLQTETATDGTAPAAGTAGHVDVAWVSVYRPA
jgi:hypothetical protein